MKSEEGRNGMPADEIVIMFSTCVRIPQRPVVSLECKNRIPTVANLFETPCADAGCQINCLSETYPVLRGGF
jgi:hypothetical protein